MESSKTEFEYDVQGGVTSTNYEKTNGEWMKSYKSVQKFDAEGNQTSSADYTWNSESGKWEGSGSQNEWAYDTQGNQTVIALYSWNSESATWIGNFRNEMKFDEKGNMTQNIYYSGWNVADNKWQESGKSIWNYDEQGRQTLYANHRWDISNQKWVGDGSKTESEFDAEGNETRTYYQWDNASDEWRRSNYSEYYTTISENLGTVAVPMVESAEATVVGYYNLSGQRLAQAPAQGIYIIVYSNGSSQKVVKK